MKEHPILMNAAMVRAVLDGSKTQTRRAMKAQSPHWKRVVHVLWDKLAAGISCRQPVDTAWAGFDVGAASGSPHYYKCPYGQPGDRLWVREAWQAWHKTSYEYDEWEPISVKQAIESKQAYFQFGPTCDAIEYRATSNSVGPWTPSIHMPRWASRINLEITSVRVERLQDISESDAIAEGVSFKPTHPRHQDSMARDAYRDLWESINGPGSWELNPWVWVIEFKQIGMGF